MAAASHIVHLNINVKAEGGANVMISDIENPLAQKKKESTAGGIVLKTTNGSLQRLTLEEAQPLFTFSSLDGQQCS